MFSAGLPSVDWVGHSTTSMCFFSHSVVALAVFWITVVPSEPSSEWEEFLDHDFNGAWPHPSDLQCGEIVLYQQKNSPKAQWVHLHASVLGKMFSGSCSALVFRQTSWCQSSLLVSSDHGTSSHTSSKSFTCAAARFLSPLKRNYHEIKDDLFLWKYKYTLPYHNCLSSHPEASISKVKATSYIFQSFSAIGVHFHWFQTKLQTLRGEGEWGAAPRPVYVKQGLNRRIVDCFTSQTLQLH